MGAGLFDWYVIRTHYAQEDRAQLNLTRQEYETILPQARVLKRRANGLLIERIRPLFTGYLFVGVVLGKRWQPIASTYGVAGFVGYCPGHATPPKVKNADIEELRRRIEEAGGYFHMGLSRPQDIRPDMMVRVLFGPFRDQTAKVKVDCGSRVQVLLQAVGAWSNVPIKLPKECLTAA